MTKEFEPAWVVHPHEALVMELAERASNEAAWDDPSFARERLAELLTEGPTRTWSNTDCRVVAMALGTSETLWLNLMANYVRETNKP